MSALASLWMPHAKAELHKCGTLQLRTSPEQKRSCLLVALHAWPCRNWSHSVIGASQHHAAQ